MTDLRRRDRELVTKDATIREIHHRVKNNLQTVAALLRLQARRIGEPAARSALEEAVRRVGSIAIVHETLSQSVEENVDFDEVADRLGAMVTDVSSVGERVRVRRVGTVRPARLRGGQRAGDGAHRGAPERRRARLPRRRGDAEIVMTARRAVGRLHLTIDDDGVGLPADFDGDVVDEPGALDRADPGGVRARRSVRPRPRPGRPGHPGRRRHPAASRLSVESRPAQRPGRCGRPGRAAARTPRRTPASSRRSTRARRLSRLDVVLDQTGHHDDLAGTGERGDVDALLTPAQRSPHGEVEVALDVEHRAGGVRVGEQRVQQVAQRVGVTRDHGPGPSAERGPDGLVDRRVRRVRTRDIIVRPRCAPGCGRCGASARAARPR